MPKILNVKSSFWERSGHCIRCGACCNVNNFVILPGMEFNEEIELDEEGWCTDYDKETRLCKIYDERPDPCVFFPRTPRDVALIPQCPFTFKRIDV